MLLILPVFANSLNQPRMNLKHKKAWESSYQWHFLTSHSPLTSHSAVWTAVP